MLKRILSLSLVLTACGSQPSESTAFSDAQKVGVLPEYGHDKVGVMLSPSLLYEYGQSAFLADLLAAGVDRIFVPRPAIDRMDEDEKDSTSNFSRTKARLKGDFEKITLVPTKSKDELSLWARDWGPLTLRDEAGGLSFADFAYVNTDIYFDDKVPGVLANELQRKNMVSTLRLQGGNFMSNAQGHCLMTNRVLKDNSKLSPAAVRDQLAKELNCSEVTIIPEIPYEKTGHIDIFAKFLSDEVIAINELRSETVELIKDSNDRAKAKEIQATLLKAADILGKLGFKLVKIPMPAPLVSQNHFPSYSNSLIVKETIFVPRYKQRYGDWSKPPVAYIDAALLKTYERDVEAAFAEAGYKVKFHSMPTMDGGSSMVDMFESLMGSIHCLTMQIPL